MVNKSVRIIYYQHMTDRSDRINKLLIIRNDKLGDFMLSLPTFALLRAALPDAQIAALLPDYTRDIAQASGYIDAIIRDPGAADTSAQRLLQQALRAENYDAVLTLYSTTRIGWCVFRAAIPYRLAPATKLAQFFYNHRLSQRRSQSSKPEYAYNLDLGKRLLADFGIPAPADPAPPYLQFDTKELATLRQTFQEHLHLNTTLPLVFIHPGSGGSAVNLSLGQYARLAHALYHLIPVTFVISAGPGEVERAQGLAAMLKAIPHVVYQSQQGLVMFAKHIGFADLFISGSTGPLHIAGALNRPTAGFYPRRRSATALRWQTLSSDDRRLVFSPPDNTAVEDMSGIDVEHSAGQIAQQLLGR
jgi:ADP-heptose:LPS heptosyltransferase